MGEVGFVRGEHARVLIVGDEVGELVARMEAYEPHRSIFAMKREEL